MDSLFLVIWVVIFFACILSGHWIIAIVAGLGVYENLKGWPDKW
jgi:hypothetical protein